MDLQTRIKNAISYTNVILKSESKAGLRSEYLRKVVGLLSDILKTHYQKQKKLTDLATPEDAEEIFGT
jgi:hypothetical protein